MARRTSGNRLNRPEVAVVKAMIASGDYRDQDIQAYFTRPTRTVNHARIAEIRHGQRHHAVAAASEEELREFLSCWPNYDAETSLSPIDDELLVKAREAMIAAVHTFNGAGATFRSELFIVTAIIAWTYLLHAWFKREGIDYRHRRGGEVVRTREGAEKYFELGACLRHGRSPASAGVCRNIEFLLKLRHEIEHRSTNKIDDALSAKLQACCINFNDAIKEWFGDHLGLERRLPIALQFVTFNTAQRSALKKATRLPEHIEASIDSFERALSEEQYKDTAYRYRVAFVPIVKQRASAADTSIEFIRGGSEEAEAVNRVLLKEVERKRYTASEVVRFMRASGYPHFGMGDHTKLWQSLGAKAEGKQFGGVGDYRGHWIWYEPWIDRVRAHCEEQGDRYR
ncbi:MAG: DUF3644 domain-containing protein [Alphaproteobacteria bacterium]|nr:DUF3644 domain-containing protein [Alphaproteobacteria bacterium]